MSETVELGLTVESHGHHVVARIGQRANQLTVFQQCFADPVNAGLKLVSGGLLVSKTEIHDQVFSVYIG